MLTAGMGGKDGQVHPGIMGFNAAMLDSYVKGGQVDMLQGSRVARLASSVRNIYGDPAMNVAFFEIAKLKEAQREDVTKFYDGLVRQMGGQKTLTQNALELKDEAKGGVAAIVEANKKVILSDTVKLSRVSRSSLILSTTQVVVRTVRTSLTS
jgi:hypothetical protein